MRCWGELSARDTLNVAVMPGLVPGIHAFFLDKNDVDGRDKPGHDDNIESVTRGQLTPAPQNRS